MIAGAGNETTGRLIGWLAKVLAEHPDQRRAVVEDRSLIPQVIDETLRFEPTGHASARYTLQDFDAHGQTIPAGSAVLLIVAAANRDPRRYERSEEYDIGRPDIAHLTFGYGLHYCLGANLARLEGRVALDEILNRWPEWDIDYDGDAVGADLHGPRLGTHAHHRAMTDLDPVVIPAESRPRTRAPSAHRWSSTGAQRAPGECSSGAPQRCGVARRSGWP